MTSQFSFSNIRLFTPIRSRHQSIGHTCWLFSALSAALLLSVSSTASAQGHLLWEDQLDVAGGNDMARGVTVSGNLAVAIGTGTTANGEQTLLVRGYDVTTGAIQWQDRAALFSGLIAKVVIDSTGQAVFGAGYAPDRTNPSGTDFLVRAYDAGTGQRLWENVTNIGRDDMVEDIAASPEGVFVVGYGGNTAGQTSRFLVRAYNKRTGTLLWQDQVGDGMNEAAAWQVETQDGMVFVAGSVTTNANRDAIIRAYDGLTGALAWESIYPNASPNTLVADASRVYVAGSTTGTSFTGFLAAYDLRTGSVVWYVPAASDGYILDLAIRRSRIMALGAGGYMGAYQAETGILMWEHQPVRTLDGSVDLPSAIDAGSGQVFVTGTSSVALKSATWYVRAYDLTSGALLWDDRSHRGRVFGTKPFDLVVADGRVFAVGASTAFEDPTNSNFLVRAYSVSRQIGPPNFERGNDQDNSLVESSGYDGNAIHGPSQGLRTNAVKFDLQVLDEPRTRASSATAR